MTKGQRALCEEADRLLRVIEGADNDELAEYGKPWCAGKRSTLSRYYTAADPSIRSRVEQQSARLFAVVNASDEALNS